MNWKAQTYHQHFNLLLIVLFLEEICGIDREGYHTKNGNITRNVKRKNILNTIPPHYGVHCHLLLLFLLFLLFVCLFIYLSNLLLFLSFIHSFFLSFYSFISLFFLFSYFEYSSFSASVNMYLLLLYNVKLP